MRVGWYGYDGLYRHDNSGFETLPTHAQSIPLPAGSVRGNFLVGKPLARVNRIQRRAIHRGKSEAGFALRLISFHHVMKDGTIWGAAAKTGAARKPRRLLESSAIAIQTSSFMRWLQTPVYPIVGFTVGYIAGATDILVDWRTARSLRPARSRRVPSAARRLGRARVRLAPCFGLHNGDGKTFDMPVKNRRHPCNDSNTRPEIAGGAFPREIWVRLTGDKMTDMTPRPRCNLFPYLCLCATNPMRFVGFGYSGSGVCCINDSGHYRKASPRTKDCTMSHFRNSGRNYNGNLCSARTADIQGRPGCCSVARTAKPRASHRPLRRVQAKGCLTLMWSLWRSPDALRSPGRGRLGFRCKPR